MWTDPLFILVVLACGITAAILLVGVMNFGRTGIENARRSNRLMRWRVAAQLIAVALIVLFVFMRSRGGP
ncbi:MAG: twin transmembrane helix small protein [Roseovarius sp.]